MKFYLSTVADLDAIVDGTDIKTINKNITAPFAKGCGFGIEIADYCIAEYLDEEYDDAYKLVSEKVSVNPDTIFHAPYNELFPTAIDKRVRDVAIYRYEQALKLAKDFGAKKIVIHSGYMPASYYKVFFISQSIKFWKEFLANHPGDYIICLENVMDDDPGMLLEIVKTVDDDRLRLCVDVGHANVTGTDPAKWIETCGKYISHLHIHNNYGVEKDGEGGASADKHLPLGEGVIDIDLLLHKAQKIDDNITATVECNNLKPCADWLKERGWV